jgi:multidrug efflux pump subunit AcrB
MDKMRESVKGFPGVEVSIAKNADGPATGKPINLEIQGDEIDELATVSEDVLKYLEGKNIPGIEELKADVKIGKPELTVDIDREAARRYGVSTYDIANAIRTSVYGAEVSKFKEGEDEYPIFVRLDERYRYDVENLLNQKITFRSPATGKISQVPISAVADVNFSSTYSSIKRKNLKRAITIYSDVVQGYNANEIIAELTDLMKVYPLPSGFTWEFTGEQQQQAEDMGFLMTAFSVAIFAIFLIIVAQFNSLASPVIIALSILFSTIGVFLGYVFTGRTISVIFTGVGIVSLAGVVVNNAIVLIDYIKLLIRRRLERQGQNKIYDLPQEQIKEDIIQAGGTRLRPVLLTAITTVLGLVPLAIGFNFNFFTLVTETDPRIFIGGDNTAIWGPMAWTVIYGLIFATFLTLIVVPVMYWLAYRLQMGMMKVFKRVSSSNEAEAKPGLQT